MGEQTRIVNMSSAEAKRVVFAELDGVRGLTRIRWKPARDTRSARQNAYYWAVVVAMLRDYLREQGWDGSRNDTHELLKSKFLSRGVVDPRTGVVVGETTRSTASLDTAEFADYLELCIHWLVDMFGIIVPPSHGG